MPMKFDNEQQEAINTTGTSVLVSASAGAGKTGVLVARLLKRCTVDRIPIQSILAVTFTEAAANEMKKRLAKELHGQMANTEDPEQLAYLKEQLIALSAASITTIDSYCLSIIQKYYNVIGLDPAAAQNVLSEGVKETMQKEAFLTCWNELHQNDPDMAEKLAAWFSPRSEDYDALYQAAVQISSCADSVMDPHAWYEKIKSLYPSVSHFSDFPKEIMDPFYHSFELQLHNIENDLGRMMAFAETDTKVKPEVLKQKQIALQNCLNAVQEQNYSMYCSSLDLLAGTATSPSTQNKPYSKIRASMDKKVKDLLAKRFSEKQYIADGQEMSVIVNSLTDLAEHTSAAFHALKIEHACIDFSDMERYALDILMKNHGAVAEIIRQSFQEIMIDEFQDTSELQNAIISCIAQKDNVFRVGDVKQSIYAFRQAKPSLMRSLMKDPSNHLITLRHNYRSKDSIVRFTNLLFEKLMNVPGAKDTYSELDHVTIGNPTFQSEPAPVPVIFADIDEPEEEAEDDSQEDASDTDEESASSKELKASWIAEKILSLMKEDTSISYRDFAVLTRSHADKLYLKAAFDHVNIPYDIDTREGFYRSELCQTILAMCSVMSDPSDTISLLSVLTSSFCQISDEELAKMKIAHGSLSAGVRAEHPEILAEMQELNEIAEKDGILAMLNEIADRHGFFNSLDDSQKANFDFLFAQTVTARPANLSAFIETMTVSQEEHSSEAMSKGKDDDAVTVTTIHHSKGLQYAIVFLWSTSKNAFQSAKSPLLVSEELGLGLKHYDMPWRIERPTVQRIAVSYQMDLEDQEEFTRLFYVALTRAEKRLFIVDTVKQDTFSVQQMSLSLLSARKGMSGLILSALNDSPYFKHIIVSPNTAVTASALRDLSIASLPHLKEQPETFTETATPSSKETSTLLPLDLTKRTSGTAYGTLMHEWAAKLPNTVWTSDDVKGSPDPEALLKFASSELYRQCLQGEIHKEYPFYIEKKELHCTGAMDMISILPQKVILVDFKTDNASMAEIQNRYTDQLNEYRKALKILYPEHTVTAYAYSFHNNASIEIEEK
jgi:ATP-dependent helicase/nuclease subunit A